MKLWVVLWGALLARAWADDDTPTKFGDAVQIEGKMERTYTEFEDGLIFDVRSPKDRNLTITKNELPLDARFVIGATGGPWIGILPYSWIISTSDNATDYIGKLEAPYDTEKLKQLGVTEDNTYIARLALDGESWIVDETSWNVHREYSKTRLLKMRSMDGEYRLLARNNQDTGLSLIEFGSGGPHNWNISAGGQQVAEWIDGFRIQLSCSEDAYINVNIAPGVDQTELPPGGISLNPYRWVVKTTIPGSADINASMRIPLNKVALRAVYKDNVPEWAAVALTWRRQEENQWDNIQGNVSVSKDGNSYELTNLEVLSGEYLIVVNPSESAPDLRSMVKMTRTAIEA